MFVQRLGIDQAMLEVASKKAQDGATAVTSAVSKNKETLVIEIQNIGDSPFMLILQSPIVVYVTDNCSVYTVHV